MTRRQPSKRLATPRPVAAPRPTAADVRRILGDLDDSKVCRVLETEADMAELQQAAAAINGELPPHIGRPITGPAGLIYELLVADELDDPGPSRRGPSVEP